MTKKKTRLLDKYPSRHSFFLNPYISARFTSCPSCDKPTRARKFLFWVNISPAQPLILNMTGRYCPKCDLLILHKDKLETLIAFSLQQSAPALIGNEYLVMGTVDRKGWRETEKQGGDIKTALAHLVVFKEVVEIKPAHYGWVPKK
jgi:hypothetical protein